MKLLLATLLVSIPFSSAFANDCTNEVRSYIRRAYTWNQVPADGFRETSTVTALEVSLESQDAVHSTYSAEFSVYSTKETGWPDVEGSRPAWHNNRHTDYEGSVVVKTNDCSLVSSHFNKVNATFDKRLPGAPRGL